MLQGMANHLVELVTRARALLACYQRDARMAVLCCCITDSDSLSRLRHRADINGEAVGVGLTERPNFISNICDNALLSCIVFIGRA